MMMTLMVILLPRIDAASDGQAISPTLFHVRRVRKESGWFAVHCRCHEPDPLH